MLLITKLIKQIAIRFWNFLFAVNGNWGEWSSFVKCSVTCGGGRQDRVRSCDSPPSAHGGLDCLLSDGSTKRAKDEVFVRTCSSDPCPGKIFDLCFVLLFLRFFTLFVFRRKVINLENNYMMLYSKISLPSFWLKLDTNFNKIEVSVFTFFLFETI